MPGSIRSMHVEHVFRDVQTDRGSLLHGRLLRWQFNTVTLAHRCRRGASTLYHRRRLVSRSHMLARRVHPLGVTRRPPRALRAWQATYSWPFKITWAGKGGWPLILIVRWPQSGSRM